ncbi:MAG: hypothetical protein EOO27_09170, partial [Comamonadaceae bacterium]
MKVNRLVLQVLAAGPQAAAAPDIDPRPTARVRRLSEFDCWLDFAEVAATLRTAGRAASISLVGSRKIAAGTSERYM